jgi:hypothetical protein
MAVMEAKQEMHTPEMGADADVDGSRMNVDELPAAGESTFPLPSPAC